MAWSSTKREQSRDPLEAVKELSFSIVLKLRAKSWSLLRSMSILPMEASFPFKWRKRETFRRAPLVSVFFTGPSVSELSPGITYVLTVVRTDNVFVVFWKCLAYFKSPKWIAFVISFPFLSFPCVWYPSKKVWGLVIPNILLLKSVWLPLCLSTEVRNEPRILIPKLFVVICSSVCRFYSNRLRGKRYIIMIVHNKLSGQGDGEVLPINLTNCCLYVN